MKRIDAKVNKDNPSLVDFFIDGEKIENMVCLPPVRVGKGTIETTARIVVTKAPIKGEHDENNSSTEEGIYLQDKQQQEPSSDGAGEDDIPPTKRYRKKATKED